jgi:stage V sporulation protein AD
MGTVRELGVKDANNMGAAMAPAAYSTIRAHFDDLGHSAEDYDLIVTGDLGQTGKELLLELARQDGLALAGRLTDCGTLIFDPEKQDVHSGGSGCGCSAVTLCGYLLSKVQNGKYRRILFCGTGALLSPTSTQQGLPIPGVCHAVSIAGGL